ncbi:MAG TPA: spirocyclase AveC family protein [Pseudonocardia sp.]
MTVGEAGQRAVWMGGRRGSALELAAGLGAVLAVFEAYIVLKWVLGPGFTPVRLGPTPVPAWIKVGAITGQALFVLIAGVMIHRLVIRPWRRERTVGFDGLLCVASLLTSVYDSSSAYFHNWFTYNAYLVNMGNPATGLPGWQAYTAPGETIAWPILFFPTLYAIVFVALPAFGCVVMRQARRRWPRMPKVGLMAICYLTMLVGSIVLEGQLFMRLGLYLETGWSFQFLDSTYSHNPLRNILLFGVLFTGLSSLRFFRNDRGQTLVERGPERLGASPGRLLAMRFLAVLAAVQVIIGLGYHLPMALTTLASPDARWHDVMVDNSYLNDQICGVGTPRTCPGR